MHPISAQGPSARFPMPTVSPHTGEARIPVFRGVVRELAVPSRRRHPLLRRSAFKNRVTRPCSNTCILRPASITPPCHTRRGNRKRHPTIIIIHIIIIINLVTDASMSLQTLRLASRSSAVPFSSIFSRVFASVAWHPGRRGETPLTKRKEGGRKASIMPFPIWENAFLTSPRIQNYQRLRP